MDEVIDFLINLVADIADVFIDLFVNRIFKRKKGYIELKTDRENSTK